MKLYYSLLFIVIAVATCQANRLQQIPRQLARQGELITSYEKSFKLNPKTLLIPDAYKPGYLRVPYDDLSSPYEEYYNPGVHKRNAEALLIEQIEAEAAARDAELTKIDAEALSKISEADRKILLSKLTKAERQALLVKLEDLDLKTVLPIEENRFGFGSGSVPTSGLAGAAAQIGAGAGGYIGGKLAGSLGAKLGAAAGAYLGAAAAARLQSTVRGLTISGLKKNNAAANAAAAANNADQNKQGVNNGYRGNYGAAMAKNKLFS